MGFLEGMSGEKTFYIKTYGCEANRADSQRIKEGMISLGLREVGDEAADFVIVNSCAVKTPTQIKIERHVKEILEKKNGSKVIMAGCLASIKQRLGESVPDELELTNTDPFSTINRVNELLGNNTQIKVEFKELGLNIQKSEQISGNISSVVNETLIRPIKISEGCLSACSYCQTKLARGSLRSTPIENILDEIKKSLEQDVKEFHLTSADVFCYGFERRENLADLLKEICKLKGEFRIRVGMGSPQHLERYKEEFVKVVNGDEKIYRFLHLPVQSGSDAVLRLMYRNYAVGQVEDLYKYLRENIFGLTISTDIICGFPGELEEDFLKTLEFVKKNKPDFLNISRFWVRPGTRAAGMKQIHLRDIKKRSRELTKVYKEVGLENHKRLVGRSFDAFINEIKKGGVVGRNLFYHPIFINCNYRESHGLFGSVQRVKVVKARPNFVFAKII